MINYYQVKNPQTNQNDFYNAQDGSYIHSTDFNANPGQYNNLGNAPATFNPKYNIPQGAVPINGQQYNTTPLQQANFNNIQQFGNTLYGTPKATPPAQPSNIISSTQLQSGLSTPDIKSQLPVNSGNAAASVYNNGVLADNKQTSNDLQTQIDTIKAQQLKEAQGNVDKANSATDQYNNALQPVIDAYNTDLTNKTNAAKGIYTQDYYTQQLQDKKDITDDLVGYSKLVDQQLNSMPQTGLTSVINGQKNALLADYNAKIAVKNAALSAIDGNLGLVSDMLNTGATQLNTYYNNKIDFQKTANAVFNTADLKTLTDQTITDLQNKQKQLQATQTAIQTLMSDPASAVAANKAGVSLTDTADQVAQKMNDFYAKNPGYLPDNVATNKNLAAKYGDAGIMPYDTPDIVATKLNRSALYLKDVQAIKQSGQVLNSNGVLVQNQVGGSRSWRNNNPGNIKYGTFAAQYGASQDANGFAVFPTLEAGQQAMTALLSSNGYKNLTLDQALKRWSDGAYGADITGIGGNTSMQQIIQYPDLMKQVTDAIQKQEGWIEGTTSGSSTANITGLDTNQISKLQSIGLTPIQQENVAGIINGTRPPLTGFGANSKEGQAITAGTNALGFDLTKATEDWTAMTKYISTLNSGQQVKLRQAALAVPDMLNNVSSLYDNLNSSMISSGFAPLQQANLNIAMSGTYGADIQAKAIQLNQQITDITADLATIYKGGNSATDQALQTANTQLSGKWTPETFNSAVNLIRQNIQYRLNAIQNSGAITGQGTNQYSDPLNIGVSTTTNSIKDPLNILQ